MDWDGTGTFALFLSSGAVGVGIILLRAYKARLAAKLGWARLERAGPLVTAAASTSGAWQ